MQIEFPEQEVSLPAVGDEKAGKADLTTGGGRIRFGLYLDREVRRQVAQTDGGRLQIFASVVSPGAPGGPSVLQLSAEREGIAATDRRRQPAEVPAEVAALVTALGGRVRIEVAGVSPDVSPDTALETH